MRLSDEERLARMVEAHATKANLAAYREETKELAKARKGREAAMVAAIDRLQREAAEGQCDDQQLDIDTGDAP